MIHARAALLAALALTAANAAKPLVIDDPVYVAFAQQARAHLGDPYGFDLYWGDAPEPALGIGTIPPVLPYSLAAAMALFGDRPVAWKLSLFPFALALTGSLAFLLGRFARPLATPVLFAAALGPSVLPGLNLMLDVPAVALGLLGYALFVAACERARAGLALASGLALGLAMQTKYSAVVYPALVLAHAAIYRRPREGAVALLAATGLFAGWEGLMLARYGQSHFLAGIHQIRTLEILPAVARAEAEAPGTRALYWMLSLFSLAGGTAVFPGLLAGVGLGARRAQVVGAALVAGAGFAVILALPHAPAFQAEGFFGLNAARYPEVFVFLPFGLCVLIALAAVALRRLRRETGLDLRIDRVLVCWLLMEVAGYFVISPYPAVRRLIGFGIAATLLAARAASLRAADPDARRGARIAVAFGLALGAIFFGADLSDARARRDVIARAVERLPQLGARADGETIWYLGHWELQFYAERAGLRPLIGGVSQLRQGDWLVLCFGVAQPSIDFPPDGFRLKDQLVAASAWPWSTIPLYYDGFTPLHRQPATQPYIRIFRVTRDLVPRLLAPEPVPARENAPGAWHRGRSRILEHETGLEPATPTLATWRSTN